jgi:hypothetical protein
MSRLIEAKLKYVLLLNEAIGTQIFLGFLHGYYAVSIDKNSLKLEGNTWEGFLVS